jgi:hypothetical protein
MKRWVRLINVVASLTCINLLSQASIQAQGVDQRDTTRSRLPIQISQVGSALQINHSLTTTVQLPDTATSAIAVSSPEADSTVEFSGSANPPELNSPRLSPADDASNAVSKSQSTLQQAVPLTPASFEEEGVSLNGNSTAAIAVDQATTAKLCQEASTKPELSLFFAPSAAVPAAVNASNETASASNPASSQGQSLALCPIPSAPVAAASTWIAQLTAQARSNQANNLQPEAAQLNSQGVEADTTNPAALSSDGLAEAVEKELTRDDKPPTPEEIDALIQELRSLQEARKANPTESSSDQLTEGQDDELPTPEEVEALIQELISYKQAPQRWINPYRGSSPGITLGIPSGFGADGGQFFAAVGGGITRINSKDGAASIGFGLGNASKSIGLQITYTSYSISPQKFFNLFGVDIGNIPASDRPFGSGGFNIKVHKDFGEGWVAAIGADSVISTGPKVGGIRGLAQNEIQGTYYATASKLIALRADASQPFSSMAVTVGVGTGRFLPERQQVSNAFDGTFYLTPFGSVALRVIPTMSFITEWSGNDLAMGFSIVPFRNLPLLLTPMIRDIAGPDNINGARFMMGVGLSF